MNAKIIAGWLGVAFVIWWVMEDKAAAAHLVHNVGVFLSSAAGGLTRAVGLI